MTLKSSQPLSTPRTSDHVLELGYVRDFSNSLDIRFGFKPSTTPRTQGLVVCNGRTEWIEKYNHLPSDFEISSSSSYATWDHRGQGASGGARAWVDDYMSYSRDAKSIISHTMQETPYNLVCHSMGALIGLHALMHGLISPRCLVLCSPLIELPHRPLKPGIAYNISKIISIAGLGHINSGGGRHSKRDFADNILTHSASRFATIQNSPYPVRSPTFQWIKATFDATKTLNDPEKLKKINIPILILCGTKEEVVNKGALLPWIQLAQKNSKSSVDFEWIDGARHELLFESNPFYERTITAIKQWFDRVGCPI
jgi:lysophospholipase